MKVMVDDKLIDSLKSFMGAGVASISTLHAGSATIDSLGENPDYCGAIFSPIDSTLFEKYSDIHVSNLGTIARGFFKLAAGKSVAAGDNIYQTHNQALHDAVLAGDVSAMPYTQLLCKMKDDFFFWLNMTANGSDSVMLSPNTGFGAPRYDGDPYGCDCYVIAAVQSSD